MLQAQVRILRMYLHLSNVILRSLFATSRGAASEYNDFIVRGTKQLGSRRLTALNRPVGPSCVANSNEDSKRTAHSTGYRANR